MSTPHRLVRSAVARPHFSMEKWGWVGKCGRLIPRKMSDDDDAELADLRALRAERLGGGAGLVRTELD